MTDANSNQDIAARLQALEGKKKWLLDSGEWRLEPPTEAEANRVKKESKVWYPESTGEALKLREVEQALGVTFPEAYLQLLLYSDGGELHGPRSDVYFFPMRDLPEFNPDPEWSQELPDMVIFGNDTGDYLYYFDPESRLGRGAWAVCGVEMGAVGFDYSIYVANDIGHMVERILNGDAILDGPYLIDERKEGGED